MIFNGFFVNGLYQYLAEKGNAPAWLMIAFVLVCIASSYLLGSLNFAIIVSNKRYKDDVRMHGSGNGGTTNMLRTYGKRAAVLTILGDMLKAVVAVTIGCTLLGLTFGGYLCAFFCVLGHVFPIFYRFKGGKGVATSAAAILMLNPFVFLVIIFVFAVIVVGTKYVSLGSVMAALIYPVVLHTVDEITMSWYVTHNTLPGSDIIFAFLMMVTVVFMHRENIKRLISGTESKISFKKKNKDKDSGNE